MTTQPVDPLGWQTPFAEKDGRASPFFIRQWQNLINLVLSVQTTVTNIATLNARNVIAGTGLTGGGNLTADVTLNIGNTTVVAGSYGNATQVGNFTVNAQGQLTAAGNVTIPTITAKDEGSTLTSAITSIDFVGGGISATNIGGAVTVQVTTGAGGSYSDEEAQDAVGGILTDTATINLTYADATPSITADIIAVPGSLITLLTDYQEYTTAGNGETHTVADSTNPIIWFRRTDNAARTTLTLNLPATPVDTQIVIMTGRGSSSSPTFSGNGNTLLWETPSAPASIANTNLIVFIYDLAATTWHGLQKA